MKFHQEGMPFIAGSTLLAILALVINGTFGCIMTALALSVLYFFRDPERVLPDEDNIIISPADGKVIDVSQDQYQGTKYMRVSIFLNVYDVHVNRIPLAGKITQKTYKRGTFVHAGSEKAGQTNESLTLKIEGKITMFVRQVAGMVARRIICYADNGDSVKIGERYGIIKFGSRVDLFLPLETKIVVKKGQTTIGGETIIARIGKQVRETIDTQTQVRA